MDNTLTQLTLAVELYEQGLSYTEIVAPLGQHRETARIWLKDITSEGLSGVLVRHTQARTNVGVIPILFIMRVLRA